MSRTREVLVANWERAPVPLRVVAGAALALALVVIVSFFRRAVDGDASLVALATTMYLCVVHATLGFGLIARRRWSATLFVGFPIALTLPFLVVSDRDTLLEVGTSVTAACVAWALIAGAYIRYSDSARAFLRLGSRRR